MTEPPCFACPLCGLVSYHAKDIEHRFCARCGFVDDVTFLDRMRRIAPKSIADLERKAEQEADPIARRFARAALAELKATPQPAPEQSQADPEAASASPEGEGSMTFASDKTTTRLPTATCPYCNNRLSAATHATEAVSPKPGDLSVCIHCASVLVFDALLRPSKPAPEQLDAAFKLDKPFAELVRKHQQIVRGLDSRKPPETKQ